MSDGYVLDSFAILALLGREPGSEEVSALLQQAQTGQIRLWMSWVNVGEVAYIVQRRWGQNRLLQVLALLEATRIEMVAVGRELALGAARIKADNPVAYADALAAALAVQQEATLVTGDPEFSSLSETISIHWLLQETPKRNKPAG